MVLCRRTLNLQSAFAPMNCTHNVDTLKASKRKTGLQRYAKCRPAALKARKFGLPGSSASPGWERGLSTRTFATSKFKEAAEPDRRGRLSPCRLLWHSKLVIALGRQA